MKKILYLLLLAIMPFTFHVQAESSYADVVTDEVIAKQRLHLVKNTEGKGFGPQSPRNINSATGNNKRSFGMAPVSSEMNLCNIHFHKNAEHSGGQFVKYAGNGNGRGHKSGYIYSGKLSESESNPVKEDICPSEFGKLQSGDTIEVHYVYSSAQVNPGHTLGACLNDSIKNPQLRVETQVYVLVNDSNALNFSKLTQFDQKNSNYQALNIPTNTGKPIIYEGSTTGPAYNETGSPFQVTWSVRPNVAKVNVNTVGAWCKANAFGESHAHGVRNLIVNPDLLSHIK